MTVIGTASYCILPTFIIVVSAKFQLQVSKNMAGIFFPSNSTDHLNVIRGLLGDLWTPG